MNNRSTAFQPNIATELVRTAKSWLIDRLEATNKPDASLSDTVTDTLLTLSKHFSWIGKVKTEPKKTGHQSSLNYYLTELTHQFYLRDLDKEIAGVFNLKKHLDKNLDKDKKLFFLLTYYEILNRLAREFGQYSTNFPNPETPRLRIRAMLQLHYETDAALAEELEFLPARLEEALLLREAELKNEYQQIRSGLTTNLIERSMQARKNSRKTAPLMRNVKTADPLEIKHAPEEKRRPTTTSSATNLPLTLDLPPLIIKKNPQSEIEPEDLTKKLNLLLSQIPDHGNTLKRYKEAANQYQIELFSEILDEIETCYKKNDKHSLFSTLTPRGNNSVSGIATALRELYFTPPRPQASIADQAEAEDAHRRKQLRIDIAIRETRPEFDEAWQHYKIMKELSTASSIRSFLEKLHQNKEQLKARTDSKWMTFVKVCGFAVATILGLPLGLVGGAYLGYKTFFGSWSSWSKSGQVLLNKIDRLTDEARVVPGARQG